MLTYPRAQIEQGQIFHGPNHMRADAAPSDNYSPSLSAKAKCSLVFSVTTRHNILENDLKKKLGAVPLTNSSDGGGGGGICALSQL